MDPARAGTGCRVALRDNPGGPRCFCNVRLPGRSRRESHRQCNRCSAHLDVGAGPVGVLPGRADHRNHLAAGELTAEVTAEVAAEDGRALIKTRWGAPQGSGERVDHALCNGC